MNNWEQTITNFMMIAGAAFTIIKVVRVFSEKQKPLCTKRFSEMEEQIDKLKTSDTKTLLTLEGIKTKVELIYHSLTNNN